VTQTEWKFELRLDSDLVATFTNPIPITFSHVLNGVGEGTLIYYANSSEEAAEFLVDGNGHLYTWDMVVYELWVWRKHHIEGHWQLLWQGPIVNQQLDVRTGQVTITAWTREGYLQRLILGMEERPNLLDGGYFEEDWDYGEWSVSGNIEESTVTDPLWRRDYSARLIAEDVDVDGYGYIENSFIIEPTGNFNVVYFSMALMLQAYADMQFETFVGFVRHDVAEPSTESWEQHANHQIEIPKDYALAAAEGSEEWIQLTMPTQQLANYRNRYTVRIYVAGHLGWIGSGDPPGLIVGEVEARRWANISSQSGWDVATFPAALYDHIIEHYLPGWTRDVTEVGEVWSSNIVERLTDHADVRSLLDGMTKYGDWYVRLGEQEMVFEPRKGGHKAITFDHSDVTDCTVLVNGADAANKVVALAESSTGPNKEEGYATRPNFGAPLHRVIHSQPSTKVRDLDTLEAAKEVNDRGPTLIEVTGSPANGTILLADAGGYNLEVGDSVDWDIAYGYVSMEFAAKLIELVIDPLNDKIETTWETREPAE